MNEYVFYLVRMDSNDILRGPFIQSQIQSNLDAHTNELLSKNVKLSILDYKLISDSIVKKVDNESIV